MHFVLSRAKLPLAPRDEADRYAPLIVSIRLRKSNSNSVYSVDTLFLGTEQCTPVTDSLVSHRLQSAIDLNFKERGIQHETASSSRP